MSLRFPVIDSKKNLGNEEEDYNFVNKDKKRKPSSSGQSLQIIEQLKRKIQEQKKEIDNRNITIQGLQRNFESLSQIVKNQKAQSAALKQQLQNYRKNQSSNDKRASEFHEKYITASNELKKTKEEWEKFRKMHLNCGQHLFQAQKLKAEVASMEEKYQQLLTKLNQVDAEKSELKQEISRLRGVEEERIKQVKINERLRQQLQREKQGESKYKAIMASKDQQINRSRLQLEQKQKIVSQSVQTQQRLNSKISMLEKQIQRLQLSLTKSLTESQQLKQLSQNKELFNQLKVQEEQKLRRQIQKLTDERNQLREQLKQTQEKLQQAQEKLEDNELKLIDATVELGKERGEHQKSVAEFREKEHEYLAELEKIKQQTRELSEFVQKLTGEKYMLEKQFENDSSSYGDRVSTLNKELNEISSNMSQLQRKYGTYLKQIDENRLISPVVITNEKEMQSIRDKQSQLMQQRNSLRTQLNKLQEKHQITSKYVKSLESQVNSKSSQIIQLNRRLHKFQLEEEELHKILTEEKTKLSTLEEQRLRTKQQLQEKLKEKQSLLQQQRLQLEETRRKQLQKQLALQQYKQKLQAYQKEELMLKQLVEKEKQTIENFKRQKELQVQEMLRQKELLIEKQKKNNKLLWQDNKKLKEYEESLKDQALRQVQQLQQEKLMEMERLKKQMELKLNNLKHSSMKQTQTNSNELKKILVQKSQQIKIISQNYSQLQAESQKVKKQLTKFLQQAEFYKNRNKELQALLERVQKQSKEKLYESEKEVKSYKEVVGVYQKKEKKAIKEREDMEEKLKNVENQLFRLKKKYENQKIDQKLSLIKTTLSDLQLSLKTLLNTFSCNYCVQTVQECIRLQDCGHIYCKKCKAGYQPNCGQCKIKSRPKPDKNITEGVSKAEYMKILLTTIKDDIEKITL